MPLLQYPIGVVLYVNGSRCMILHTPDHQVTRKPYIYLEHLHLHHNDKFHQSENECQNSVARFTIFRIAPAQLMISGHFPLCVWVPIVINLYLSQIK